MASVVGIYARAFADVVVDRKLDPGGLVRELHSIETLLAGSEQLRRVLENPSIPKGGKLAVLDGIAKAVGISRPVRNFVAVVTSHRRLPVFTKILRQVERELDDRLGFAEAEVTSARELSESEKRLLESQIARMTSRSVRARYQRDASLLGGAVVKVGSTIYDGSVKGQLRKIREQLVENAL